TFPYVMKLASMGAKSAIKSDEGIRQGVNTYDGHVTYKAVAESQKRPSVNVADLQRVEKHGDIFEPVLKLKQKLPKLAALEILGGVPTPQRKPSARKRRTA